MDDGSTTAARRKQLLRRDLVAARKARSAARRDAAIRANESELLRLLTGRSVVCGYLPLASEPMTTGLLDRAVAAGTTVLVPVVTADAPLDWCRYPCPMVVGAFGIAEPTGRRWGPAAVRSADTILVPALAVDSIGRRLGRGGGHYDRTLALLPPQADGGSPELIAVLFDGELIDELPEECHDRRVTAAVAGADGLHHFPW